MAVPANAVADEAAMLALIVSQGDWCFRIDRTMTWRLTGTNPAILAHWTEKGLPAGASVYQDSVTSAWTIASDGEAETFHAYDATGVSGPSSIDTMTSDPGAPVTGQIWLRTDL